MRVDVLLEPDQTPDQLTDLARLCESAGIQTLWLQNYLSSRDPFMSLVPAAKATRRVGLGVCVVSPWEMHPVKMANALLTLHEFSNGRAGLVIGGGGEWLGRTGIQPQRRVRAVREALELVKRGTAGGGAALNYKGEMYQAWGYRPQFGTGGVPPLVYVGANRTQMLHAGVPATDGVMYSDMPRARIADVVGQTRQALADRQRDPAGYRISNIWAWHVKPTREAAEFEANREMLLRGYLERWYLEAFLSPADCDLVDKVKPVFFKAYRSHSGNLEGVPEHIQSALRDNLTLTSDIAGLDAKLPELAVFQQAGVNELCFRLHDDPADAIRLIGERVIPRLPEILGTA